MHAFVVCIRILALKCGVQDGSLLYLKHYRVCAMINNLDDLQKLSQSNMDTAVKAFGEWNKSMQAIASEMGAYSKRTFDESTSTFERLISAKSVEQALEIQANFAKRTMEDYVEQMSKISSLYTDLAKDAYKPFDKAMKNGKASNGKSS